VSQKRSGGARSSYGKEPHLVAGARWNSIDQIRTGIESFSRGKARNHDEPEKVGKAMEGHGIEVELRRSVMETNGNDKNRICTAKRGLREETNGRGKAETSPAMDWKCRTKQRISIQQNRKSKARTRCEKDTN
jgi:hypothetical protein